MTRAMDAVSVSQKGSEVSHPRNTSFIREERNTWEPKRAKLITNDTLKQRLDFFFLLLFLAGSQHDVFCISHSSAVVIVLSLTSSSGSLPFVPSATCLQSLQTPAGSLRSSRSIPGCQQSQQVFNISGLHWRDAYGWVRAWALNYQLKLMTTTRAPWHWRAESISDPGLTRH